MKKSKNKFSNHEQKLRRERFGTTTEETEEENFSLAAVLGVDKKAKEEQEKQARLRKELWNYLGVVASTAPKMSFEEVLKESLMKKEETKTVRRNTVDYSKVGQDFATKNAWGMNPSLL